MRFFLIFILSAAGLFCFFYFYPAHIFQAEITGGISTITTDVSLQSWLFKKQLPSELVAENISSIHLTLQGIMILIVCLVALPLMIALRFAKKQH